MKYGFQRYGIFSRSPIVMPKIQVNGVNGYLKIPISDAVVYVQSSLHNKVKILHPRAASLSEWKVNGYMFRGTSIADLEGNYLIIEQYKE